MRLIDADAKIVAQLYDDEQEEWILKEMTVADYLSFSDTSIPFVDAVPVVRCGQCRYSREPNRAFRDESVACDGVLVCCAGFDHVHPSSDDGMIFVDADGFCSNGQRREEEHNAAD